MRYVGRPVGVMLAWGLLVGAGSSVHAEQDQVVGRVRVRTERVGAAPSPPLLSPQIRERLESSHRNSRLLAVRPALDQLNAVTAAIYDYQLETAFEIVFDQHGRELSRTVLEPLPAASLDEQNEARRIVEDQRRGPAADAIRFYPAMPTAERDETGRRRINVGIIERRAGEPADLHEIVSVHLPTRHILRYPNLAPPTSRAGEATCGPPNSACSTPPASCGAPVHFSWPADNPVWEFELVHPWCTTQYQPDGTGIELRRLHYKGDLVIERAHMPVLNVQYQNNLCGPYRDWLWEENCFVASGVDVAPGFRVTSGVAPETNCESHTDNGAFNGVAVHDEGNALWIVSEMAAGWYRYVSEWRLHLDGTIEPLMGFGATENSCVCNLHFHHAYWRIEWALGGTAGDLLSGIDVVERRRAGTSNTWDPIATEQKFNRNLTDPASDWVRLRHPASGRAWVIQPRSTDGSAQGISYARGDFWALTHAPTEINDPNTATEINIDPWLTGEALGTTKRSVTWYHATYTHDINGLGVGPDHAEDCHLSGPAFVRQRCRGDLSLDLPIYRCEQALTVRLDDSDRAGLGSTSVTLSSEREPLGETLTMLENPPASGLFEGSLQTTADAPSSDGRLSVQTGNLITASYLDASACGTPSVEIARQAEVDCTLPEAEFVRVSEITATSAKVRWNVPDAIHALVHYGTTDPNAQTASGTTNGPQALVELTGLSACTTYRFSVESIDRAGNSAVHSNYGNYFSFTTAAGTGWCGAHASLANSQLASDQCHAGGAGNANGVLESGEIGTLVLTIQNDGNVALSNLRVRVEPMSRAFMLDAEANVGSLTPASTATTMTPHLQLQLPAEHACGAPLSLLVTLLADQGRWQAEAVVQNGVLTPVGGLKLDEGFGSGIPAAWQVIDGGFQGGVAATWTTDNPGNRSATAPITTPFAIVDSQRAGVGAFQDEQLLTPRLDLSTATQVTLDYDHFFRWGGGSQSQEVVSVDVRSSRTGDYWQRVSSNQGASSPNPEHRALDLTSWTAGAADAQIRFYFTNGNADGWWQVDNVKVQYSDPPQCSQVACPSPAASPPAPIDQLLVSELAMTPALELAWGTCAPQDAQLLFGDLTQVARLTPVGAVCWLGSGPTYQWLEVPTTSSWLLVVPSTSSGGAEGSWGRASDLSERGPSTGSLRCYRSSRELSAACP